MNTTWNMNVSVRYVERVIRMSKERLRDIENNFKDNLADGLHCAEWYESEMTWLIKQNKRYREARKLISKKAKEHERSINDYYISGLRRGLKQSLLIIDESLEESE